MNAAIFLYERPIRQVKGERFEMPDKLYLKAYCDRTGVHLVDESHQETDTADVMAHRYLEGGMNHSFYTMALYYGGYQRGIMLIDIDEEYHASYQIIKNEINLTVSHFKL